MSPAVVYVGAGPGAPDLVTRRGRDRLAAAEVVVADRPSLDGIIDRYAPGAERLLVGRTPGQRAWTLDAVADLLAGHHGAGRRVVRLKSGDVFVCSRAAEEILALRDRSVAVEVVPGVSAAVAAPLAAGLPVLPAGAGAFTVVAGNGDPLSPPVDWAALPGVLVVLLGRSHQRAIAERLMAAGRAPDTAVHLVHGATRDRQQVVATTLAGWGSTRLPAPATAVIGGP
jgi:uroporphyrin-III C-methyltransferase/precorrin-2 dehydrogenase/sirohydrochlorin ferrochelatase